MFALEIADLRKTFARPAVDGLDLKIRSGEFYALLGPNGAGKTTTLRMVAGLLKPDAGSVSILGVDALADPVAAKQITARSRSSASMPCATPSPPRGSRPGFPTSR